MNPAGDFGGAVRLSLLDDSDDAGVVGVVGVVDNDTLYRLYAYPGDLDRPLVRGNVITSLDGGATTGGTSGGLGGPGDRWLFSAQRELADVVVVGAGTARAEGYGGVRLTVPQRRSRRRRDQSEVPPIAVVTRSGSLETDLAVLTETEARPLVLTAASVADSTRSRLGSSAEVLDCSGSDPAEVDLAVALDRLAERGLLRVLTEGGPSLLGAFIAQRLLDELCLTAAPVLVGGTAVRVAVGQADVLNRMSRAHVLADDDGYLYFRYTRAD